MEESKCYGLPNLTDLQLSKLVAASEDLASQKACFWCFQKMQSARRQDQIEYYNWTKLSKKEKKSHKGMKMSKKHQKSHKDMNMSSRKLPKKLKLNPAVPNPPFLYSTAEGKRRALEMANEKTTQHSRMKEIEEHSYNPLCTIQEAEEEEDESATGTDVFYNVHICAHAYEKARSTGTGPRNETIHRLVKICDFETLKQTDIAELGYQFENLGRFGFCY